MQQKVLIRGLLDRPCVYRNEAASNESRYLDTRTILNTAVVIAIIFLYAAFVHAQQPTGSPDDDEQPVRISTSLIQLDVLVTDKNGNPVTDLRPDDLVVFQDGKRQEIVGFSYEDGQNPQDRRRSGGERDKNEKGIQRPPVSVRRAEGRLITFVLDDGNCFATRDGLSIMANEMRSFIDTKMLPDDRVAIYRTASGSSLLQLYTSDRSVLRRIVNKLHLNPSRSCFSTFGSEKSSSSGAGRSQILTSIGVLDQVLERVKSVPSRKSIFFLSEGLPVRIDRSSREALNELYDKAARSSVVINPFNTRGLTNPATLEVNPDLLPDLVTGIDRSQPGFETPEDEERTLGEGLADIANGTGGRYIRNSNRLDIDIARVLQVQSAYYLIAYEPNIDTFRSKAFHQIEVTAVRPDLVVTARQGFFGRSNEAAAPGYKTPDSPLYQAIASPFAENSLDVKTTFLAGHSANVGHYLRTLIHIKGSDLALLIDDRRQGKVSFDVVAVVLDEKGKLVDEFNRTYPITISSEGLQFVERNGLDYSTDIPIKTPGVYSIRFAIRNNNTKSIGSAGELLTVPRIRDRELFVTGLAVSGVGNNGKPVLTARRPVATAFEPSASLSVPAVRMFNRGETLYYAYSVHNWSQVREKDATSLSREVRLYRNGKEVVSLAAASLENVSVAGDKRLNAFGTIRLGDEFEAGDYALQIVIRDKGSNRVATQWIDFEVMY